MPTVPVAPGGGRVDLSNGTSARAAEPQFAAPDAKLPTPSLSTSLIGTPQLRPDLMRPALADPSAIRRVQVSDRGASETMAMGRDLGSAADAMQRAVMSVQLKVNSTIVDDALNDARTAASRITFGEKKDGGIVGGYRNLKGYDAIKPGDKPLDEQVGEQYADAVKQIVAAKITNPDQRRAFDAQSSDIGAQLRQGALSHQADEFDNYHTAVYTAAVQNQTAAFASLDIGDRAGQQKAMDALEGAVGTLAVHKGASDAELQVGLRAARSAAVGSLFDAAVAAKNYTGAQGIVNTYGKQIDPNELVKMKTTLDGHVGKQLGQQLGDDTWNHWAAPSVNAGDADRGFNIVKVFGEGFGKARHVGEDGKLLVSPKGAYGIAQIMPDTAKAMAKKLGRPELFDLSHQVTKEGQAANELLGRTYFNGLVAQFNGDMPKVFAAYNAGAGWLVGGHDSKGNKIEGALKQAAATGQDWRTFLPKETQDYVTRTMKSYGSGEGTPAKPTREELYAKVDAQSDDPDVRAAAHAVLDKHFANSEADERDGYDNAYAEGLRVVRETHDINAIQPELKARIKPEQYTSLQTYAKNITDGAYQSTKPAAYYVAMNPTSLKAMNINQLEAMRPDLSEEDFKTARNLWNDVHAPQPGKGPESLDVSMLDSLVDTRLQYLGVNPKPKAKDAEETARIGAIRQFTHQYVLDAQRQSGTKVVDFGDMEKIVNNMFLREQTFRNTFIGIPGTGPRGAQTVLTAGVRDIPADTISRIKDQLKKGLRRDPNQAEILQAYFRSQFYRGG